jgi:hypothetical protein
MDSFPEQYSTGWFDSTIGDLVQGDVGLIARFQYVLISSLDSVMDLASSRIGSKLFLAVPGCRQLGKGILLPGLSLTPAARAFSLFVGFDEIWCFDVAPTLSKPDELSILPPPEFRSSAPSAAVLEWMLATGCRLALGDGIGLNYVAADAQLATELSDAVARVESS